MTLPIINGTTALSSAALHLLAWGDGQTNLAICGYRIKWTSGILFEVSSGWGSTSTIPDVTATWDAVNSWVDVNWSAIDFQNGGAGGPTNYDGAPIMIVTPVSGATGVVNYLPFAATETVGTGHIMFVSVVTHAQQGTPDAKMDCFLFLLGRIV